MALSDKLLNALGAILALLVTYCFYQALFVAPTDAMQGDVYRIIYLHVPSAASAFLMGFILFILAILTLVQKEESLLQRQVACVEVGLIFTVITLVTGSIWGKPTWGTWWTWDARLTTTLLLGILFAGYRLIYNALDPGPKRMTICSIVAIIIAIDIPIIYKSVTWWRTLHQPPSIIRSGGDVLSPEIRQLLTLSLVSVTLFAVWLLLKRTRVIALRNNVEEQSYAQLSR
jgi:heme exporter protein C